MIDLIDKWMDDKLFVLLILIGYLECFYLAFRSKRQSGCYSQVTLLCLFLLYNHCISCYLKCGVQRFTHGVRFVRTVHKHGFLLLRKFKFIPRNQKVKKNRYCTHCG